MAKDYVSIAARAKNLIQDAGRLVTFRKYNQTSDDGNKPWSSNADLRSNPTDQVSLWAVSVHPTDINVLGIRIRDEDFLKRVREILIVAPGEDQTDLKEFQEVDDGTRRFRITFMEELRPANVRILWYAGVTQ